METLYSMFSFRFSLILCLFLLCVTLYTHCVCVSLLLLCFFLSSSFSWCLFYLPSLSFLPPPLLPGCVSARTDFVTFAFGFSRLVSCRNIRKHTECSIVSKRMRECVFCFVIFVLIKTRIWACKKPIHHIFTQQSDSIRYVLLSHVLFTFYSPAVLVFCLNLLLFESIQCIFFSIFRFDCLSFLFNIPPFWLRQARMRPKLHRNKRSSMWWPSCFIVSLALLRTPTRPGLNERGRARACECTQQNMQANVCNSFIISDLFWNVNAYDGDGKL